MKVTYTLAEPEFCEAYLAVLRFRDPGEFRKRKRQIASISALGLLIASIPIYFSIRFGSITWISSPLLVGTVAFELWIVSLVHQLVTLRTVKKKIREQYKRAPESHVNVHLIIDDSGWQDDTPGISKTKVEWGAFLVWLETDNMLIAVQRASLFHMVPKRVLAPDDLDQLRKVLGNHIATQTRIAG